MNMNPSDNTSRYFKYLPYYDLERNHTLNRKKN